MNLDHLRIVTFVLNRRDVNNLHAQWNTNDLYIINRTMVYTMSSEQIITNTNLWKWMIGCGSYYGWTWCAWRCDQLRQKQRWKPWLLERASNPIGDPRRGQWACPTLYSVAAYPSSPPTSLLLHLHPPFFQFPKHQTLNPSSVLSFFSSVPVPHVYALDRDNTGIINYRAGPSAFILMGLRPMGFHLTSHQFTPPTFFFCEIPFLFLSSHVSIKRCNIWEK